MKALFVAGATESTGCHMHPLGCPIPRPIVCRVCLRRCNEPPCWWSKLVARLKRVASGR